MEQTMTSFVRYRDLAPLGIQFSRTHLERLEKDGAFPKRVQITPGGSIGWVRTEIEAFAQRAIASRPAQK
jgi:predicted DNA-binding transcriptional regulator AlpA